MEAKFREIIPVNEFSYNLPKNLKAKAVTELGKAAIDKVIQYGVIEMKNCPEGVVVTLDFIFFTRHQYKDIVRVLKDIKESMEKKEDPLIHLENLCNALRA